MRKTFLTLACLLLATMGWAQTDTASTATST